MIIMFRPGSILLFLLCLFFSSVFISPSHAQSNCANYKFASNQIFSSCNDLPYLNSSLHWNYDQATKAVKIAYRQTGITSSRWVAWALNPTGQGMLGAQSLVAFQKSDGTMRVYTSPVTAYRTRLPEGDLSFPVSDLSATCSGNEIIIFATLRLDNMNSTLNQVWQVGPMFGDSPGIHAFAVPNLRSMGTLNLLSGETRTTSGAVGSNTKKKNIHGILNAVSWGILLPIGVVFARYLKVFPSADPTWFYLHAACQSSAYIVGVAGWATGLSLGNQSPGVQYTAHRIIGIVIFCLATLQVSALLLRPNKEHKYRFYWNIYHHLIGYSVIVLSAVNIFKGFAILSSGGKWKEVYIGFLIGLGILAVILEIYTWAVVLKRKKSIPSDQNMPNGARPQNSV